jgi:hypothetical protein
MSKAFYCIADGLDHSRNLVTEHLRHFDALIHLAVKDMEVCSANTAVRDPDLDVVAAGGDWYALPDPDRLRTRIIGCIHLCSPLTMMLSV